MKHWQIWFASPCGHLWEEWEKTESGFWNLWPVLHLLPQPLNDYSNILTLTPDPQLVWISKAAVPLMEKGCLEAARNGTQAIYLGQTFILIVSFMPLEVGYVQGEEVIITLEFPEIWFLSWCCFDVFSMLTITSSYFMAPTPSISYPFAIAGLGLF